MIRISLAAACLAGALLASIVLGQNPPSAATHRRRAQAVNAARLINTAEITYRSRNGRYAGWRELRPLARQIQFAGPVRPSHAELVLQDAPEVIPGWRLELTTSADGAHYQFALQDTEDKACGFSFFSDDHGVIYQGKAINCPVD